MKVRVDWDDGRLEKALTDWHRHSKKSAEVNLRQQGKLFVGDLVRETPPNDGRPGKSRGDAAVKADLALALRASNRKNAGDPQRIHEAARKRNGRVRKSTRPQPARGVPAYRRKVLAMVGWLAGGWNAAASRLGARLPAWISRHGNSAGAVLIRMNWPSMDIVMINRVGFVGGVKNLSRRLARAARRRTAALVKQTEYYLKRDARRSGFR